MARGDPIGILFQHISLCQGCLSQVTDNEMPILELRRDRLCLLKTLLRRASNSIDLGLEVMPSIFRILKQVNDISNSTLFSDHASGCRSDCVHSILGSQECKPTHIATVLKVGMELYRSEEEDQVINKWPRHNVRN